MSIGDLARYLMVSRQNLSGLISRMERDGHVAVAPERAGSPIARGDDDGVGPPCVAGTSPCPKIHAYYDEILADFSVNDITHTLHYLLKILENMQRLDATAATEAIEDVAG